jgi:hypothetical protein
MKYADDSTTGTIPEIIGADNLLKRPTTIRQLTYFLK